MIQQRETQILEVPLGGEVLSEAVLVMIAVTPQSLHYYSDGELQGNEASHRYLEGLVCLERHF